MKTYLVHYVGTFETAEKQYHFSRIVFVEKMSESFIIQNEKDLLELINEINNGAFSKVKMLNFSLLDS